MSIMAEFFRWADAITEYAREHEVEVRVWPVDLVMGEDEVPVAIDYCWTTLVDERTEREWNIIHAAMLRAEPLRPQWLVPSPALAALLRAQN